MGDTILFGVLRMPYELAMGDELSRLQYWQRGQQAADEIERLREALQVIAKQPYDSALNPNFQIARTALGEKE